MTRSGPDEDRSADLPTGIPLCYGTPRRPGDRRRRLAPRVLGRVAGLIFDHVPDGSARPDTGRALRTDRQGSPA